MINEHKILQPMLDKIEPDWVIVVYLQRFCPILDKFLN